ncbi:MAG: hypothetical protein M3Q29_23485, partial [Chloroflexota bacterium]|nr:hypothetical protein [Chloroflexota bacterium]
IRVWIGADPSDLAGHLMALTNGDPHQAMEIWRDWIARGVVVEEAYGYRLAPGVLETELGIIGRTLTERLELLRGDDATEVARARDILAVAALEAAADRPSHAFTAQAVAEAMGFGADEFDDFIDWLDDALEVGSDPAGVVRELGTERVGEDGQTICRYGFTSNLFWMALLRDNVLPEERPKLCGRLADALRSAYGESVGRVAATLAELYRQAGNREAEARYRRIAYYGAGPEALYNHARLLMALPRDGWDDWRRRSATKTLMQAGWAVFSRVPWEDLLEIFEAARELAVDDDDRASALLGKGRCLYGLAQYEAARDALEASRELAARIGSPEYEGGAELSLAVLDEVRGEDPRAVIGRLSGAVELLGRAGHWYEQLGALSRLSVTQLAVNRVDEASENARRALATVPRVGGGAAAAQSARAEALQALARVALRRGDLPDAEQTASEALSIYRDLGELAPQGSVLFILGWIHRDRRDWLAAFRAYSGVWRIAMALGDRRAGATAIRALGALARDAGAADLASRLTVFADSQLLLLAGTGSPHDFADARARADAAGWKKDEQVGEGPRSLSTADGVGELGIARETIDALAAYLREQSGHEQGGEHE